MFKSHSAVDLGVVALRGLLDRTGLAPAAVGDVILGTATPAARPRPSDGWWRWMPACR
ncbi:thiolase, N-terminal domain protein [Mycobacterium ulcerans str. Harvey]|uniref:Thiolase, N-terminal domain protein n=1 Tax=Mycobacterium ulcerans str. Harvey TaxID=1299332 RepID=A0ABP3AB86_MYCUL|nr:thiolase, N-terminal domain protein [Mycobacterium ulcerans str. Harvey]